MATSQSTILARTESRETNQQQDWAKSRRVLSYLTFTRTKRQEFKSLWKKAPCSFRMSIYCKKLGKLSVLRRFLPPWVQLLIWEENLRVLRTGWTILFQTATALTEGNWCRVQCKQATWMTKSRSTQTNPRAEQIQTQDAVVSRFLVSPAIMRLTLKSPTRWRSRRAKSMLKILSKVRRNFTTRSSPSDAVDSRNAFLILTLQDQTKWSQCSLWTVSSKNSNKLETLTS